MHWRVRLDNDAVIFRARFQDNDLTTVNLRQFLANTFSVALANISAGTTSTTFGTRPSPDYHHDRCRYRAHALRAIRRACRNG
jgi:hypothetical protein